MSEWAPLGAAHAALLVVTWLICLVLYPRCVPLIRADPRIAELAPPLAAGNSTLRPYWLGRSIPELAGLPRDARIWLWRDEVLRVLPWLLAAFIPFATLFVVAGGFTGAWIVLGVFGNETVWMPLAGFTIGCAVGAAVCWIVARPVLNHFMRPRLRKAREAAARRFEPGAATSPDATP